ncbi:MAG: leucine-rich repeat domain-containing protein [Treponema sp.]|jgi:hypothetical protein|nr:leucine-rich repeat domain-containing protein [Treponema sp.]
MKKKLFVVMALLCAALLLAGCVSELPAVPATSQQPVVDEPTEGIINDDTSAISVVLDVVIFKQGSLADFTAFLTQWLEKKSPEQNTAQSPVPVEIAGLDLANAEHVAALYSGITRYVDLDLQQCTGTSIVYADAPLENKKRIVSLKLPASVSRLVKGKSWNHGTFYDFAALRLVVMPGVTTIDDYSFYSCNSLAEIDLSKVAVIGASVFVSCWDLKEVDLSSATSIGTGVFSLCSNLTVITISPSNIYYYAEGSMLTDKNKTTLIAYSGAKGEIILPPTITKIEEGAFSSSEITKLEHDGVLTVGSMGFHGCDSLESISLPNATSIGTSVFLNCSKLVTANLPKVSTIGTGAFQYCRQLKTVTISGATSIGGSVFSGCTVLETVTLGAQAPVLQTVTYSGGNSASSFTDTNEAFVIAVPAGKEQGYGNNVTGWTDDLKAKVKPISQKP